MTLYNVHLYREMRLYFPGIAAASPVEAADIAADRLTEDANCIEDCEGENLAALIDIAGDDQYEHSVTIEFEAERLRRAAPEMLDALRAFVAMDELANECGVWKWESLEQAFDMARAAIAKATTLPTSQPERRTA